MRSPWCFLRIVGFTTIVACGSASSLFGQVANAQPDPTDARLFRELLVARGYKGIVGSVAFSNDGTKLIANGRADTNVKIWNVVNGQQLLAVSTGGAASVGLSADGKRFLAGSAGGVMFAAGGVVVDPQNVRAPVQIYDAVNGQPLVSLEKPCGATLTFSPDSKYVLGVDSRPASRMMMWNAADGKVIRNFSEQLLLNEGVMAVAYSPDGKKFASIGQTGGQAVQVAPGVGTFAPGTPLLRIWDTQSGKIVTTITPGLRLSSVAFGPDGKVLVGGFVTPGMMGVMKVYGAENGKETLSLNAGARVSGVCLSADGKKIVSGQWDATVRVWDATTGQALAILKGHERLVGPVAMSPDGTRIASGGGDGTVRIWGIPGTPGKQPPQPKAGK